MKDETRFALNEVIKITNLEQLQPILHTLKRSLTRGYKKQILGYSVHFLLQSAAKWTQRGALDRVLGDVAPVLFEDVFGDAAEEREVDKIRNAMKESRNVKSGDTFRLLARQMEFSEGVTAMVGPLLTQFFGKCFLNRQILGFVGCFKGMLYFSDFFVCLAKFYLWGFYG